MINFLTIQGWLLAFGWLLEHYSYLGGQSFFSKPWFCRSECHGGQYKCVIFVFRRNTKLREAEIDIHRTSMASARSYKTIRIIFTLVVLIASSISSAFSMPNDILDSSDNHLLRNQTIHLSQRVQKLKRIRSYLRRINKLAIKTIEAILLHTFQNCS